MRPLTHDDVPALLELARATIPDTLALRLGPRFAERYHRALVEAPELRVDGYVMNGELIGFVVHSRDARRALRTMFRRHAFMFSLALAGVLRSPRRLAFVLRIAATTFTRVPEAGGDIDAELLTIAVRPVARGGGALRRHGIDVPRALMEHAFHTLAAGGTRMVKIFCKPEELDPAANGFVRKSGFVFREHTRRWGVPTTLYVRTLQPPAAEGAT